MDEIRAGIYVRLSRDDERFGESMSIENQRLMLTDLCRTQGWHIVDTYADDGYSGLSFDKPSNGNIVSSRAQFVEANISIPIPISFNNILHNNTKTL